MLAPHLILLAGAPGVGKSAVAAALQERLSSSIWLDGDDLWRMQPWRVDRQTIAMVEASIVDVLRHQLTAGFEYVILSWVMHDQGIIQRLLIGLGDVPHRPHLIVLVCEDTALAQRFAADLRRGEITPLALRRLEQTHALKGGVKIDTTKMTPGRVAEHVLSALGQNGLLIL